jgi:hypothetical protein
MDRYLSAKRSLLQQGKSFNPRDLADSIINGYNDTDAKDVRKNTARSNIDAVIRQIKDNKKIDIKIDESTNLQDLIDAKVIDKDQRTYLDNQQKVLREQR